MELLHTLYFFNSHSLLKSLKYCFCLDLGCAMSISRNKPIGNILATATPNIPLTYDTPSSLHAAHRPLRR